MKKIFFTIILFLPLLALAQGNEIGLGVGISVNTAPTNNLVYKGDVVLPNYAVNASFLHNLQHNWQIGVDLHVLELSQVSSVNYPQLYTSESGGAGSKFIYGKVTSSLDLTVNRKFCKKGGYFYMGLELGVVEETDWDSRTPKGNNYYVVPDGGYGPVGGLHIGYTEISRNKITFNAEFAALGYDFYNSAHAPNVVPYTTLHYYMFAFPLTVGLRYKYSKSKSI